MSREVASTKDGKLYHDPDKTPKQRRNAGCQTRLFSEDYGFTWWTEPEEDAKAAGLKPCACIGGGLKSELADAGEQIR